MTATEHERAEFEEWRTELLDLIFHYANGAMLNGKTELKRHIARIERQINAVPRAGREAERAEAVTEYGKKLRFAPGGDAVTDVEPRRRAFYDQCGTGNPPKPNPSPDAEKRYAGWLLRRILENGWSKAQVVEHLTEKWGSPFDALSKPEGK